MSEEFVTSSMDILAICGIATLVWLYVKVLKKVKAGVLIVYRDWLDFGKSALWFVAIPLGVGLLCNEEAGYKVLGAIVLFIGCTSFSHLCTGAFRYNRGIKCWLALYARFAVVLLCVFALGKLNEKFQQYRRHEAGLISGVLIPMIVFDFAFKVLIQPMIGIRYDLARRIWND